jgi:hypothetical protein
VVGSVTGFPASFRELRGIGPATETRLHEAGVYTWDALSDLLAVLATVRGGVEGLRTELAEFADARDDGGPEAAGERAEAFVVRLSVAAGAVRRCSATHVRSQEERGWAQWPAEELLGFIREHATPDAPPPGPPPGPPSQPSAPPAPAAGSQHHLVVLDAGKVVGGVRRPVELLVPTGVLADLGAVDWSATLGGRAMGGDPAAGWEAPDRPTGRVVPPEPVLVRFERVALPGGLQRLWLRLELRLSAPAVGVPELAVEKAPAGVG